ncbi:MAG: chromosome segregation ATPase [Myxococcota bacterium]|jgi:chromosome segregation ATPase
MTRLTPLILAVALLGCRDTSDGEVGSLQGEVAELTARLEALEADAATGDTVLADFQTNSAETAADIAALEAELEALATVDLTETLAAIDDVDARIDTLEELGLATESWVETQAYLTQEAGDSLDLRIAVNSEASGVNAELISTNAAALDSQSASLLDAAAAVSTNAQALASIDARVSTTEAVAGQVQTEVTRIDTALLTLASELSDLDDGFARINEGLEGLAGRVDAVETTLGETAEQFAALAETDVSLQRDIDELSEQTARVASSVSQNDERIATNADGLNRADSARGELQAVVGELSAQTQELTVFARSNRDGITRNSAGLEQAAEARAGLAESVSANSENISRLERDVAENQEVTQSSRADIEANASRIERNVRSIAVAGENVAALEQRLNDSAGELDDVLARLDLVEVYTTTKWVTANTTTGTDSGVIGPMQMAFTKQLTDSILYVEYDDNLRTTGGNKACRWEVYFNGQPCSSPGRVAGDFYQAQGNAHEQNAVNGYCRGNSGGSFGARDVAISVRVSNSPGYSSSDCYTGWQSDQLGVLRVTEAIDEG